MSIDSCYKGVVAKLTSQGTTVKISTDLLALKSEGEKALFIYKLLDDLNAFPTVKELKKSDEKSLHFRNLGNNHFQQKEYYKAWQYYNKALTYATKSSANFCTALSNRSAVFFEIEKYKECIKDIDKVFSLPYPAKLTDKLNARKAMCNQALAKRTVLNTSNQKIDKIMQMNSPRHPIYLAASNKVEVVSNEKMGRHVIAKEDIKVGEIIVQEEPYFCLLIKTQYLFNCGYCLSRNLNLMPCDNCVYSLYCSDDCKEKAWKEYHEIECPLMATVVDMDFTKLEILALRTVIKARREHASWSDFFKTIQEADANMNTKHHGQVKVGDKWIYDSKYYASIHSLATNFKKRSMSDIFQKGVTAVVFLRFLKFNTNFMESDCESEKCRIFECVARLLFIHEMTSPTNMHGISTNTRNENGMFTEEMSIGSAPYAFCSLINHSCAPNVVRFSKLGTARMSAIALRPIKKGMQLFDNYGFHHAVTPRTTRQKSLKFQYKFDCMCEACYANWPTFMDLLYGTAGSNKVPKHILRKKERLLAMGTINRLELGDLHRAMEVYDELCQLCESLEPYAPCLELCEVQEALKQCYGIFEGLDEFGAQIEGLEKEPVDIQNFLRSCIIK